MHSAMHSAQRNLLYSLARWEGKAEKCMQWQQQLAGGQAVMAAQPQPSRVTSTVHLEGHGSADKSRESRVISQRTGLWGCRSWLQQPLSSVEFHTPCSIFSLSCLNTSSCEIFCCWICALIKAVFSPYYCLLNITAWQWSTKTIASPSHRTIVLTDTIDYRTIGFLHYHPNPSKHSQKFRRRWPWQFLLWLMNIITNKIASFPAAVISSFIFGFIYNQQQGLNFHCHLHFENWSIVWSWNFVSVSY